MRTATSIFYAALVLALGSVAVSSQNSFDESATSEGYRLLAIGKGLNAMPRSGKRSEDFVPPHWKVFARADGDLNHDGVNEAVMILQLDTDDRNYVDPHAGKKDDEENSTFMIIELRPLPDKTWTLENVNYSIGAIPSDQRDTFDISIKNNVLTVHSNTGGMERSDETYRFRDDYLIGYDFEAAPVTIQSTSEIYKLSENYLTGDRTETITTFNNKSEKGVDSVKRSTFKPNKTSFGETFAHCH